MTRVLSACFFSMSCFVVSFKTNVPFMRRMSSSIVSGSLTMRENRFFMVGAR